MTAEEAGRILGLKPGDTEVTLRRKYRRLMRIHHPDAGAADEGSYARLVAEAYELLRDTLEPAGDREEIDRFAGWPGNGWSGNGRSGSGYGAGHGARGSEQGRYYWDPDREDFLLFLKSVNAAVTDHLSEIEWKMGIYSADEHPDPGLRGKTQMKAFHLLIQEYIRPLSCLRKLDEIAEPVRGGPEAFRILGRVAAKDGPLPDAAAEDVRFGLRGSRFVAYLAGSGVELGEVSFEDDALYYLVLPMIARGAARAECADFRPVGPGEETGASKGAGPAKGTGPVKSVGAGMGTGPAKGAGSEKGRRAASGKKNRSLAMDIILTVRDAAEADRPGNGAERLQGLFGEYERNLVMISSGGINL